MFENWAHPNLVNRPVRPVRLQRQGQGARVLAKLRQQHTEAQVRVAGAAIRNALPQQVDVLNEDVIEQFAALHARDGQI
jgi:hypothetical protein